MQPQQEISASSDQFNIARAELLDSIGLQLSDIDHCIAKLMNRRLDYADVYFQSTLYETWTVEDGNVKEGVHSVDRGVGIRAISDEKTGFAYSDELDTGSLDDAVTAAREIAKEKGKGRYKVATQRAIQTIYPSINPLVGLEDAQKVALLTDLDRKVRSIDNRVIQVVGSLTGVYETILIQTSDGFLGSDVRPLVRLNVSVIMKDTQDRLEQGYAGGGGRGDFSLFTGTDLTTYNAAEAVRLADDNLEAISAHAATMAVD